MSDATPAAVTRGHLRMFLAAAAVSNAGLVLAAIGAGVARGHLGVANALVAGAVVLLFFGSGQGVQLLAGQAGGPLGLGIVVMSYAARVGLLALLLLAAMRHAAVERYLDGPGLIAGTLATTLGWVVGLIWAERHSRVPLYVSQLTSSRADERPPGSSR